MKTTFALPLLLVVIFVSEAQAQYTLADVALHNTNDDCWSAAYGEIYDLTTYAPNHPNPSVYSMCGKDGTVLFDSIHGNNMIYLDIFVTYLGTLVAPVPAPAPVPIPVPVVPVTAAPMPVTAAPVPAASVTRPPNRPIASVTRPPSRVASVTRPPSRVASVARPPSRSVSSEDGDDFFY